MATAAGGKAPGGCLTTALAISLGGGEKDPTVAQPFQLLKEFATAWKKLPKWHSAFEVVWRSAVGRLQDPNCRWSKVGGHLAAVVATLMDKGWQPHRPDKWEDPQGQLWELDLQSDICGQQLAKVLTHSFVAAVWKRGRVGRCASGAQGGVDWKATLKYHGGLVAKGEHKQAGIVGMVLQAGCWLEQRRQQAGYHADGICEACKLAPGTEWHAFWECPEATRSPLQEKPSAELVGRARHEKGSNECFWVRGLVPQAWAQELVDKSPPRLLEWAGGVFCHVDKVVIPPGSTFVAGSDGAGGTHGKSALLRRVGWGFVLMEQHDLKIVGWRAGTFDETNQTVPRAELQAVVRLAGSTNGDIVVWCDNLGTVQGVHGGPAALHAVNGDLWERFWKARTARPGLFAVKKIKSHLDEEPSLICTFPLLGVFCNLVADRLAGFAAGQVQVAEQTCNELVRLYRDVATVQQWQAARVQEVMEARGFHESCAKGSPRQARARKTWLQRLGEEKAATSHQVAWHPKGGLACLVCGTKGRGSRLFRWLRQPCAPRGMQVGLGHKIRKTRGAVWCRRCGGWATKARGLAPAVLKLGRTCLGFPTEHGKRAIAALLKGRPPQGVIDWP